MRRSRSPILAYQFEVVQKSVIVQRRIGASGFEEPLPISRTTRLWGHSSNDLAPTLELHRVATFERGHHFFRKFVDTHADSHAPILLDGVRS